jgi:hypothetical protein
MTLFDGDARRDDYPLETQQPEHDDEAYDVISQDGCNCSHS